MEHTTSLVAVAEARIRLHDPDSELWKIAHLATYLQDVDYLYLVAYERAYGQPVFGPVLTQPGVNRPNLLIEKVESGSLILKLVEEFAPIAAYGSVGASIILLAKLLKAGPGKVHEWFLLADRVRLQRTKVRRERLEEEVQIAEVEARLRRIKLVAPNLEVTIVDKNGEELAAEGELDD